MARLSQVRAVLNLDDVDPLRRRTSFTVYCFRYNTRCFQVASYQWGHVFGLELRADGHQPIGTPSGSHPSTVFIRLDSTQAMGELQPSRRRFKVSEPDYTLTDQLAPLYNLMADHPVPSQQTNYISANTYSHHPDPRQSHSHAQRVASLTVFLLVVVYSCASIFRNLMAPVMANRAYIGRVYLNQQEMWSCKVKCNILITSMHSITMRHAITITHL